MGKQEKEEEDARAQQPDKKKARIDSGATTASNGTTSHEAPEVDASSLLLVEQAWEHFVNYLESSMIAPQEGGDIDELYEILSLFDLLADDDDDETMTRPPAAMNGSDECGDDDKTMKLKVEPIAPNQNNDFQQVIQQVFTSKRAMLPILMSVVYYIFADKAIDHFLMGKQQQQKDNTCSSSSQAKTKSPPQEQKDCCRANACCAPPQQEQQAAAADEDNDNSDDDEATTKRMIQHFIRKSLHYNPYAASTWSMAANFGRMTHALNATQICTWYEYAAELAHVTRTTTLKHLESMETLAQQEKEATSAANKKENDEGGDENADESSDLKQWIEVLLLNQTAAVEWSGEDDEDDDEGDDDNDSAEVTKKEEKGDKKKEEAYGKDSWSASLVESTSRFMAAMQLSIAGKHDEALQKHLKKFCLTHRLHPNLWNNSIKNNKSTKSASINEVTTMENSNDSDSSSLPVLRFSQKGTSGGGGGGVLPQSLYQRLCAVFAPNAAYWRESDYSSRGYYSYFMDRRKEKDGTISVDNNDDKDDAQNKNNLIRDVIENHLLPLVEQAISGKHATTTPNEEIVGYEWWVHTRPIQANLGHNLHFDTDEALLFQEKLVTHPIYSSVLYLTGGSDGKGGGGPTIVLDQTPDAQTVAQRGWRNEPTDNSLFLFPGNLLHGVLPCPGETTKSTKTDDDDNTKGTMVPDLNDLWKNDDKEEEQQEEHNRLTFMVGFWTRRVPDGMKEQKLYGPCGRLPPANEKEHSWVLEISKGYDDASAAKNAGISTVSQENTMDDIQVEIVSPVTPVWEEIECYQQNDGNKEENESGEPPLDIPGAIDHRFFVQGAPQCFRDSLFERDEFDDCNDNDSEDYDEEDDGDEEEVEKEK